MTQSRLILIEGGTDISHVESVINNRDFSYAVIVDEKDAPIPAHLKDNKKLFWMLGTKASDLFPKFFQIKANPSVSILLNLDEVISHPTLNSKIYSDLVQTEWVASTKMVFRAWGFKADSLRGLANVIENLPLITKTPGVNGLKDIFKGLPAIIVSTGPSLGKSLSKLKELQNKAVIVSVDASLKILIDNGIYPHLVVSLERDMALLPYFEKVKWESVKHSPHLVAFAMVPAEVLSAFQGPKWVAYRNYGFFALLEKQMPRGILSSSGSVAHLALKVLSHTGVQSITLVGQDLALDPVSKVSHAQGVAYEEWAKIPFKDLAHAEPIVWTEGNLRDVVPTTPTYFSFMKEFSWEKSQISATLTNSTEGGAKIPNVPWISLDRVSADWKELSVDLFKTLADKHADFKPTNQLSAAQVLQILESYKARLHLLNEQVSSFEGASMAPIELEILVKLLRTTFDSLRSDQFFQYSVVLAMGRDYIFLENDLQKARYSNDVVREIQLSFNWIKLAEEMVNDLIELWKRA